MIKISEINLPAKFINITSDDQKNKLMHYFCAIWGCNTELPETRSMEDFTRLAIYKDCTAYRSRNDKAVDSVMTLIDFNEIDWEETTYPFKVKVIKCSEADAWYNDMIGQIFEVCEKHKPSENYKIKGGGCLAPEDCEIIKENKITIDMLRPGMRLKLRDDLICNKMYDQESSFIPEMCDANGIITFKGIAPETKYRKCTFYVKENEWNYSISMIDHIIEEPKQEVKMNKKIKFSDLKYPCVITDIGRNDEKLKTLNKVLCKNEFRVLVPEETYELYFRGCLTDCSWEWSHQQGWYKSNPPYSASTFYSFDDIDFDATEASKDQDIKQDSNKEDYSFLLVKEEELPCECYVTDDTDMPVQNLTKVCIIYQILENTPYKYESDCRWKYAYSKKRVDEYLNKKQDINKKIKVSDITFPGIIYDLDEEKKNKVMNALGVKWYSSHSPELVKLNYDAIRVYNDRQVHQDTKSAIKKEFTIDEPDAISFASTRTKKSFSVEEIDNISFKKGAK